MTNVGTRPPMADRTDAVVRVAPAGWLTGPTFVMAVLWALILSGGPGCGDDDGANSPYGNSSPTGTFLSPSQRDGPGGNGYEVLDEACDDVDAPDYLTRFETPMFRSVAVAGGVAHLVDGSLLWSVSILDATAPERLSLKRLDGHPLQIAANDRGHLFVAAGEAGLHVLKSFDATTMVAGRDTVNASAVEPKLVANVELPGPALDVALMDGGSTAVVAAGAAGLVVVDASRLGAPEVVARLELPGFAFAVDVEGDFAYVAACSVLAVIDISDPRDPQLVGGYWVPHGHARGVDAVQNQIFVAGGEALFVYDATTPEEVRWTGYYAEPDVVGFYVNDVVVQQSVAYIAAGDESVRSVDASAMSNAVGFPATKVEGTEPPALSGPEVLPDNDLETIWVETRDPVGIGLTDDLLLVLGNFRWMGERTLRIMRVDGTGRMTDVGAYVQPNGPIGAAQTGSSLVLHGATGVETVVSTSGATPLQLALGSPVRRTAAMDNALWLLTEDDRLFYWVDGEPAATELVAGGGHDAFDLTLGIDSVYLSSRSDNAILRLWQPSSSLQADPVALPEASFPGFSYLLVHDGSLYAYEWITGVLHRLRLPSTPGIPPDGEPDAVRIGQCEMYDIADYFSGRTDNRTRLLAGEAALHVLCPHDAEGRSTVLTVSQPAPGEAFAIDEKVLRVDRYVDLVSHHGTLYALSFDNNRYLSRLTQLLAEPWPAVTFDGHANALLSTRSGLLVSDGDFGGRLFESGPDGVPVQLDLLTWP